MVLKTRQWIVLAGLLLLIVLASATLILTRGSGSLATRGRPRRAPLVDESPVQTARNLATLATTREEQRFANQALRLADHAVDLAFAEGMREATLHPSANTPQAKETFDRVRRAEAQVKSDQKIIDTLKNESAAAKNPPQDLQQQLDLLQAQMELDKDELDDAKGDLLRSGADSLGRIQRQFARYQAAQQQSDAARAQANLPGIDSVPAASTLIAHIAAWRGQRAKVAQLQQARDESLQKREQLQQQHAQAEQSPQPGTETQAAPAGATQDEAIIKTLRRLSERHKNLADLNNRIQDHQDLGDVYGNWIAFAQSVQLIAVRGIVQSLLLIVFVILAVYLANLIVGQFFSDSHGDRRRMRTLRTIVNFAVQATGVLLILFVLVGVPAQMPTILGLAGAGLTVALKDFIVGFFGWFALMGRNGIHVGDWVEIEGVVGEVIEIGLMRTVLLETGNWNDTGHPTGRKVAFVNSYAIEGHYFNFSTSGQWLWDELQILVPADRDPYPVIEGIQKLVAAATDANAHHAEAEWKRATHDRMRSVSAAPAINLRPTPAGVEVHVRYVTRAQERYATRTKLYQEIVDLLHQKPATETANSRQ